MNRAEATVEANVAALLAGPGCDPGCGLHAEHVYVLCYGQPTLITDRDWAAYDPREEDANYPISHYVGWTRRHPPIARVRQHGARSGHFIAKIVPGDRQDEALVKATGQCPRCSGSLDYHAESPHRPPGVHA